MTIARATTPSALRKRIELRVAVLIELGRALEGASLRWGQMEASYKRSIAAELGIELVTKTAAEKRGHVLKRGAEPLGSIYFGAPISRHAPVYVLGVHTKPSKSAVAQPSPEPLFDDEDLDESW